MRSRGPASDQRGRMADDLSPDGIHYSLEYHGDGNPFSEEASATHPLKRGTAGNPPHNGARFLGYEWRMGFTFLDTAAGHATRQFRILSLCFFFTSFINQSVLTHHVAFFVDQGLQALFASYIAGLVGMVSIVGKIFWGTLSDRIGREVTFTLVIVCTICAMVLLIIFTRLSFLKIPYLYALFFGLGYAGLAVLSPLIAADFFDGAAYGSIYGTLYLFHGLGGAFGAWFAGFLYDHVQSYVPLFVTVIGCALLACVTVWLAAPRRIRPASKSGSGMSP